MLIEFANLEVLAVHVCIHTCLTGVEGDHENLKPQKSTMDCMFSYLCTSMNVSNLLIWQNYCILN